MVERITAATATACTGENEQKIGVWCGVGDVILRKMCTWIISAVLNCVSLLTRLLPFLFEAEDWRLLFWSPANFLEVG